MLVSEATLEQLKAQIELLQEYPKVFRGSNGLIVKFSGLHSGIVMESHESRWKIGNHSNSWTKHSDTSAWTPINYNKQLDLYDGKLCYAWDNELSYVSIGRYDALYHGLYVTGRDSRLAVFKHYSATIPTHLINT